MLVVVVVLPHWRLLLRRLFFLATSTPSWLLRPDLHQLYFCQAFPSHFTASAMVLSGRFLPTGIFYLALLPHSLTHFVTQMRAGTPHPGYSSMPAFIELSLMTSACS